MYAKGSAYQFGVSAASAAFEKNPGRDGAFAEPQVEAAWTFTTLNEVGQIAFNVPLLFGGGWSKGGRICRT